jgi:hypothetical protein
MPNAPHLATATVLADLLETRSVGSIRTHSQQVSWKGRSGRYASQSALLRLPRLVRSGSRLASSAHPVAASACKFMATSRSQLATIRDIE